MARPKGKKNYPEEFDRLAVSHLRENLRLTAKGLQFKIEGENPQYTTRTFQDILKKALPIAQALAKLDQPWHLGLMSNPDSDYKSGSGYTISSETIGSILSVQRWMDKHFKNTPLNLSIRQALWISRLHSAFKNSDEDLWRSSFIYSEYEILCELKKKSCDTTEFDKGLRKGINALYQIYKSEVSKKENDKYAIEAFMRMEGF